MNESKNAVFDQNGEPVGAMGKRALKALRELELDLLHNALDCREPHGVELSRSFALYVAHMGVHRKNALLVLQLLETNNRYVIDGLLGSKNPYLLFSTTKPNTLLLARSFDLLRYHRSKELYRPALLALLGMVDMAYNASSDGFGLYPLSVNDLYSLCKYLDKASDQDEESNKVILRIAEHLFAMGQAAGASREMKSMADHAMRIRITFLDKRKKLEDLMPEELLMEDGDKIHVPPLSRLAPFGS